MILELDCGNSLIKWRIVDADGVCIVSGVASDSALLVDELKTYHILGCRLVSVRSDAETKALADVLTQALGVAVRIAAPAPELAGVKNGYNEYTRLGMDRWLAVVAGFHLANGACVVIDLGTAVTVDFVDRNGHHLGGYICPGIELMRGQLQQHTRRIRYTPSAEDALKLNTPGTNTAEAVERGCVMMLQSFARAQLEVAKQLLGEHCQVFVTGGDAQWVLDDLPGARWIDDLVFKGLIHACPME